MALFFLLLAIGARGDAQPRGGVGGGEYVSGLAVGRVWEHDPGGAADLEGFRLGFVAISREPSARYGHAGSYYVEWKSNGQQRAFEGGLEVAFPYVHLPRVSLGPRVRAAIQQRREPPYQGWDVALGIGAEVGVWLTPRLQLAAMVDRSVGFDAPARTSYAAHLRVMLWRD